MSYRRPKKEENYNHNISVTKTTITHETNIVEDNELHF